MRSGALPVENEMRVGEICRKPVVTVTPGVPIAEVAKLMRVRHVGSIVVVDAPGTLKPVGIVTDRDIVIEVLATGVDPAIVSAGDIMTGSPVVVSASEDVMWALKTMRDRGIRRLPVVDDRNTLVGILALDDMLQHLGGAISDVVQLLGTERLEEGLRRA